MVVAQAFRVDLSMAIVNPTYGIGFTFLRPCLTGLGVNPPVLHLVVGTTVSSSSSSGGCRAVTYRTRWMLGHVNDRRLVPSMSLLVVGLAQPLGSGEIFTSEKFAVHTTSLSCFSRLRPFIGYYLPAVGALAEGGTCLTTNLRPLSTNSPHRYQSVTYRPAPPPRAPLPTRYIGLRIRG